MSTWVLRDEEYEAVRKLTPEKRFSHFISRAADWETVWLLGDGERELAQSTDEAGTSYVPVWPHERYAEDERRGPWERCLVGEMTLADFMHDALPDIERDGLHVAVFPVHGNGTWILTPQALLAELEEAQQQY